MKGLVGLGLLLKDLDLGLFYISESGLIFLYSTVPSFDIQVTTIMIRLDIPLLFDND